MHCVGFRALGLPDTFEKHHDTPLISIAMLLQKCALLLAESSMYTTNLCHDAPPISIRIYRDAFAEVFESGLVGTPQKIGCTRRGSYSAKGRVSAF